MPVSFANNDNSLMTDENQQQPPVFDQNSSKRPSFRVTPHPLKKKKKLATDAGATATMDESTNNNGVLFDSNQNDPSSKDPSAPTLTATTTVNQGLNLLADPRQKQHLEPSSSDLEYQQHNQGESYYNDDANNKDSVETEETAMETTEEETSEEEDDSWWNETSLAIRQEGQGYDNTNANAVSPMVAHLDVLENCMQQRQQLFQDMSNVLEHFQTRVLNPQITVGRNDNEQDEPQDAASLFLTQVQGVYQQNHGQFVSYSNGCQELAHDNHLRRMDMLERLDSAHVAWQQTYQTLTRRVLDQDGDDEAMDDSSPPNDKDADMPDPPSSPGTVNKPDKDSSSKDKDAATTTDPTTANDSNKDQEDDASSDSVGATIDWDEILRYLPSKGVGPSAIHKLLDSQDDYDKLCQQHGLEHALLSNYLETVQSSHNQLMQVLGNFIFSSLDQLEAQERDLQQLMASNYDRRQKLQQAVEASARQAQGLFASLMARVTAVRQVAFSCGKSGGNPNDQLAVGANESVHQEQPAQFPATSAVAAAVGDGDAMTNAMLMMEHHLQQHQGLGNPRQD